MLHADSGCIVERMGKARVALVSLLAVLYFGACSQAAPSLLSVELRLVSQAADMGAYKERLSFFVLAADDDGIIDLDELYLLNDQSQLFWSLDASEWIRVDAPGQTWLGSHSLAMPQGDAFPRGLYRAVLIDKSGERAERQTALDVDEGTAKPLPLFTIENGRYSIVSDYQSNSIVFYDGAMKIIETKPFPALEGSLSELGRPAGARYVALWAEDGAQTAALTEARVLP